MQGQTIDLIEMLKDKIKGKISEYIEKIIDKIFSGLCLNYTHEKAKFEEKKVEENSSDV